MTFQDPLDITLFVQRKVLSSALPFIQRHYFKKRWIRTLQMAARAWVGFLLDYIAIAILFGVYGVHLDNWNIVWKSVIGVCISGDIILLTTFIIPLTCRNKKCPDSMRNMEDGLEHSCGCNLFIVQFVAFKFLSLLHALFVVAQTVLIDGNDLSSHENIGKIAIIVVASVDVLANTVEIFSSGCFWCVCCIHSPEISPEEERRRQQQQQRNQYGNTSFLTTRTEANRDEDFVFTIENNRSERNRLERNQSERNSLETSRLESNHSEINRLESSSLERNALENNCLERNALGDDNSPGNHCEEEQQPSSQTDS